MRPYQVRRTWTWLKVRGNSSQRLVCMLTVSLGTIPEPTAVLTQRKSVRMPPPRSKSPIKTFLQSPARRNPSLGPVSSPTRGSIVAPNSASLAPSVRRKLDFSMEEPDQNTMELSSMNGSPQKRVDPSSSRVASAKLASGTKLAPSRLSFVSDYDEQQDSADQMEDDTGLENGGDSFQMINGGDDEEVDEQVEEHQEQPESEPEPELPKKGRGRGKGKGKGKEKERQLEPDPEPEVSQKNARGRARKESNLPVGPGIDEPSAKRARGSLEASQPLARVSMKGKFAKPSKTSTAASAPRPKAAGKGRKLAPIQETESPEIQRGPPLPRNNRGLFILRRETPMEGTGFKQTRSGRNSIKPVAWWKNERIEYSDDIAEDSHGGKFLLPRIKEVVRNDEVDEPRRKTTYSKPYKGKKRSAPAEPEEDEIEPWEVEPGRIHGEIRTWDPEDQLGTETMETEEELALSSRAIITREVANASFGFAKTLSLPFFGSGMLDIPAGGAKKPKNSRKMQMVFFVFYGRVNVTVNETSFRIGKGGVWQVPRGKIPLSTYS